MSDTPTPGNPGTYLPIPGQAQNLDPLNRDAENAARIKSQNSTPQQGAATINDIVVGTGDGKIYTGVTTPIVDATIQRIQEFTDTATTAKGPKGDKGERGEIGPRGPAGPQGPAGPSGVVDYDLIREMIQEMLDEMLNLKSFKFVEPTPTFVYGTRTTNLPVELVDQLANTSAIVTPTSYTLGIPGAGTITLAGLLTAADVQVDTPTTVTANYTDTSGKNYTAQTSITVRALRIQSLAVSGPTSINSAGSGTYAATVTYTDGTTRVVTTTSTWTIQSGSIGTLASNVLTAAVVGANTSGVIRATFTENGTTLTADRNVTVVAPVQRAVYGVAAAPATGGAYNTFADWDDFITANLLQTGTGTGKANTITTNQGAAQYGWYAYPASLGFATFVDASNNFPGGWDGANRAFVADSATGPKTVDMLINGTTVPYYLYRTTNAAIGTKTWNIS